VAGRTLGSAGSNLVRRAPGVSHHDRKRPGEVCASSGPGAAGRDLHVYGGAAVGCVHADSSAVGEARDLCDARLAATLMTGRMAHAGAPDGTFESRPPHVSGLGAEVAPPDAPPGSNRTSPPRTQLRAGPVAAAEAPAAAVDTAGAADRGVGPSNLCFPSGGARSPSPTLEPILAPDEQARQKRMLRNRESAARSRERRKNKNCQLAATISRLRGRSESVQTLNSELTRLLGCMKAVIKRSSPREHVPP
jgi:Basic region leucine zipper